MTTFLLRRFLLLVLTFFLFLTLVFFLIQAQPGDFATAYTLDPNITPEAKEALKANFGLDRPVWQQYFIYVGNFLTGDLGTSFRHARPVTDVIFERLPRTIILFVTAAVVSFYLGFITGKVIAWRRGRLIEYGATIGGVYLYTIFTPWLALMVLWLFAFQLDWFPTGKFINPSLWINAPVAANQVFQWLIFTALGLGGVGIFALVFARRLRVKYPTFIVVGVLGIALLSTLLGWGLSDFRVYASDIVSRMILPILVLTLISFAGTMLLTRNSMLETVREDYVLAARARGLPEKTVRDKYVARNAILPVVTSLVLSIALAIDGGVITESVFSWPGLGLTLVESADSADIPLATGAFLFVGIFALVAHIVVDILYLFLDPRLRH